MSEIEVELKKIGSKLLKVYGLKSQMLKFIEESSELNSVLARRLLGHRIIEDTPIVEEIIDTFMVLSSLLEYYEDHEEFDDLARDKIAKATAWVDLKIKQREEEQ